MTVTNKSIRDVIEDIRQNHIILPALQREFVWKRRDIEALFDSLMQNYPINTMMFWIVDDITKQKLEFYEFLTPEFQEDKTKNRVYTALTSSRKTIVIDGQQRLTALLIGIYGSYTTTNGKNEMYLYMRADSAAKANTDDEDDGIISTDMLYNFKFFTKSEVVRRNKKGEHWIKVGEAYNSNFSATKYVQNNSLNDNDWAINAIERLKIIFDTSDLINYYEVKRENLEEVLDVFVRTNNGGRRLTKGDLLLSMITAYWANEQQENAREYVQNIVKDCAYSVDKDWVLNCILYLLNKDSKLTVNQFDPQTSKEIFAKKQELRAAIIETCELVKRFGMHERGLTSKLALLPIAWHIYHHNLSSSINQLYKKGQAQSVTEGIYRAMRTWLFRAIVKSFFTAGTNEKLNKIQETQIHKRKKDYFPLDEIINAVGLTITHQDIDDLLKTEKKAAFPVLNIIYSERDYLIRDLNNAFEVDHVHPFSKTPNNPKINMLPNLQLLTKEENASKNAMDLKDWWNGKSEKDKELYLLPTDFDTDIAAFDNFFEDRKKDLRGILTEKMDVFTYSSSTNISTPDSKEELEEIKKRAEAIINKHRNNPSGSLKHFVRQCESSKNLEKDGLNNQD